ncbi:aminopeptidase P family protein [Paremcibacter congregatus]|uniref:aminopeptidase P family protein n=1 Tax=Paremcibacter congregatus TaxID=2043170 RepID=UPI0030EE0764|tara:strand:+ start:1565 stop:3349 length:1785 start_codon:yes stop_codon:yes gene_type:complete
MYNRLLALRQQLRKAELQGFLVPHEDEHQCEYTPARANRLEWLTDFTGSAGLGVVTLARAALYVDGRYTLQARTQLDLKHYEILSLHEDKVEDWFLSTLKQGDRVGYDPWLHTQGFIEQMKRHLATRQIELLPLETNPLDAVWDDRPAPDLHPVKPHKIEFSGEESQDKRARIAAQLQADGVEALVISSLDSIAWLLNLRGNDVANSPLILSNVILQKSGRAIFFVDPGQVSDDVRDFLGPKVTIKPYDQFAEALRKLGAGGVKILVDPRKSHAAILDLLHQGGADIQEGDDPCQRLKACKNDVELAGMRQAHIRDGVALCKFLCWLGQAVATEEVTELSAVEKLEDFRRAQRFYQGPSFDTISGAGAHGAIIHYRVSEQTNRPIGGDMLYLVDSGGQYLDGTTDVTRTIAIGQSTEEQRDRFTRVLKGHISVARARFPVGRSGAHLDTLARRSLWDVGLDYDHGTGHGVGCYLGVHEGPQSISQRGFEVALEPGMVLSNEPGFYKPGEYGIRIENLMAVQPSHFEDEERSMNIFETLTFVPIDTGLINAHMMTSTEITWLNIYHAQVREKIAPFLEGKELAWLHRATQSIMAM